MMQAKGPASKCFWTSNVSNTARVSSWLDSENNDIEVFGIQQWIFKIWGDVWAMFVAIFGVMFGLMFRLMFGDHIGTMFKAMFGSMFRVMFGDMLGSSLGRCLS